MASCRRWRVGAAAGQELVGASDNAAQRFHLQPAPLRGRLPRTPYLGSLDGGDGPCLLVTPMSHRVDLAGGPIHAHSSHSCERQAYTTPLATPPSDPTWPPVPQEESSPPRPPGTTTPPTAQSLAGRSALSQTATKSLSALL